MCVHEIAPHEAVALFQWRQEKARSAVAIAVENGTLQRAGYCSQCGSQRKIQGHHEDYSQPLVVEWLCQHCHVVRHRQPSLKTPREVENGACPCGYLRCKARVDYTTGERFYWPNETSDDFRFLVQYRKRLGQAVN